MNGNELIQAAIKLQKVDRIPWVPFVGCHAGYLIQVNAKEYFQSEENIVNGVKAAISHYTPDGIPIVFDLQVEAEILGCDLIWADENPPAVSSHPLAENISLDDLQIPRATDGRLPLILGATRTIRKEYPDIALYGLITGPFTLALHLFGSGIFMKMYNDEAFVKRLISFCTKVCFAMSGYYIEAGCDVIAMVDPMTSQIGPDHFKQFVTKPATDIFDHIRDKKCLSSFFVCGNAQQNIEVMCECRPDNISIDENIPLDFVKEICLKHQISFGGNLQLTVVLLLGDEDDAVRNAHECMKIAGDTGFILAPGCDLPYATPAENIKAISEYIHDPYQLEIAQTLEGHEKVQDILDMSDYGRSDKIIIDIITLDSESCPPCQYMVESVKEVAPAFENIITWREHKIKHRESLTFMTSLMVKNIPTICIDGQITFVSRNPPREELIAAIQKRIFEKLNHKIRSKKGTLLIFGKDEEQCNNVKPEVERALRELGTDVDIEYITDEKEALSYGITSTPAVVTAKYSTKSEGFVPSIPAIKEWIKELQ